MNATTKQNKKNQLTMIIYIIINKEINSNFKYIIYYDRLIKKKQNNLQFWYIFLNIDYKIKKIYLKNIYI